MHVKMAPVFHKTSHLPRQTSKRIFNEHAHVLHSPDKYLFDDGYENDALGGMNIDGRGVAQRLGIGCWCANREQAEFFHAGTCRFAYWSIARLLLWSGSFRGWSKVWVWESWVLLVSVWTWLTLG